MSSVDSISARVLASLIVAVLLGGGAGAPAFASCPAASRNDTTPVLTEQLMRRHGWRPGICRLIEPDDDQAAAPENSSLAMARALEQALRDRPITALGTEPKDTAP